MPVPEIGRRRRFIPPRPVLNADSLAYKLISCHVPTGAYGMRDLALGPLIPQIGSLIWNSTPFGRGPFSSSANGGYAADIGTTGVQCIQPPLTIMWVGGFFGAPATFSPLYGVLHNITDAAPVFCYALGLDGSSNFRFSANAAGTAINAVGPAVGSRQSNVIIGTLDGTASQVYANGVPGTASTGAASITYASTTRMMMNWRFNNVLTNAVHNLGAIWNRVLSGPEIEVLSADPGRLFR